MLASGLAETVDDLTSISSIYAFVHPMDKKDVPGVVKLLKRVPNLRCDDSDRTKKGYLLMLLSTMYKSGCEGIDRNPTLALFHGKAAARLSDMPAWHISLGKSYIQASIECKDPDRKSRYALAAARYLEFALQFDSKKRDANFFLAFLHAENGDYSVALRHAEAVLELNKTDVTARRIVDDMNAALAERAAESAAAEAAKDAQKAQRRAFGELKRLNDDRVKQVIAIAAASESAHAFPPATYLSSSPVLDKTLKAERHAAAELRRGGAASSSTGDLSGTGEPSGIAYPSGAGYSSGSGDSSSSGDGSTDDSEIDLDKASAWYSE